MENECRILFLVQLPPPVHGVSMMNKIIVSNTIINQKYSSEIVELKFSDSFSSIRTYNLLKIGRFVKVFFKLRKKLQKFKPHLVYFSFMPVGPGFFRDILFLFLIKLYRVTVILHLNNRGINEHCKKAIYRFIYRSVFQNTSLIHVSEGLMHEEFQRITTTGFDKYILHNTCERANIEVITEKSNTISILFLSNLFPEKGLNIALKSYLELREIFPGIRLDIYGQVLRLKYEYEVKLFIQRNGLEDSVFFHGQADPLKKYEALSKSDIYIFPSYFREECMPLSLLEAMQAGLPVIASRIGAIPEMIEDGVNGLLIDPDNSMDLIEKLKLLIGNKEMRKKLGQNARITFNEKYSPEKFVVNLSQILDETIKK